MISRSILNKICLKSKGNKMSNLQKLKNLKAEHPKDLRAKCQKRLKTKHRKNLKVKHHKEQWFLLQVKLTSQIGLVLKIHRKKVKLQNSRNFFLEGKKSQFPSHQKQQKFQKNHQTLKDNSSHQLP